MSESDSISSIAQKTESRTNRTGKSFRSRFFPALLTHPLSNWLLRPWLDHAILWWILKRYLPTSRLWAAAAACPPPKYLTRRPSLSRKLVQQFTLAISSVRKARATYEETSQTFEDALFPDPDSDHCHLASYKLYDWQKKRDQAAHRLSYSRAAFLRQHRLVAPITPQAATPEETLLLLQERLNNPEESFPFFPDWKVEASPWFESRTGRRQYLRFISPIKKDRLLVKVDRPDGWEKHHRSAIFLHGILMEEQMWPEFRDPFAQLQKEGIEIIRISGPWHNERRVPHLTPIDPFLGHLPLSILVSFQAWVSETAIVLNWLRRNERQGVALIGVSLGALTSQLMITRCAAFHPEILPDASLLCVPSGDLLNVLKESAFASGLGLSRNLRKQGWTDDKLQMIEPLANPDALPKGFNEKTIMILGKADKILPFRKGYELAKHWELPEENLFVSSLGHFGASLEAYRNPEALERFASILLGR